jgi:hypothetical protein
VAKQDGRRVIPEEFDELGPDDVKVIIRQTDRGDTIEDADLEAEDFGGFGLTAEDGSDLLTGRIGRGPKGWAGIPPSRSPPFILQAIRQAEQVPPRLDPEGDRAEWLERVERRLEQIERQPTKLDLFREWKYLRLREHTERRIQALYCRRYKPSATLEAKRFPKLPAIATKLLPKIARRQPAAERRAELAGLVAQFLAYGGKVAQCPSEMTTVQLARGKRKIKIGRPLFGERPLTAAERKRRSRAKWKLPIAHRPLRLAPVRCLGSAPDRGRWRRNQCLVTAWSGGFCCVRC